jgi:hypothetical protein
MRDSGATAAKQHLGKGNGVGIAMGQTINVRTEIIILERTNVGHSRQTRPRSVAKLPRK